MIYGFSLYKVRGFVDTNLVSKIEKKINEMYIYFFQLLTVLLVRCPGRKTSGFQTVRILKILRTSGPEVMSGRALMWGGYARN